MKKIFILPALLLPMICAAQPHRLDITLLKDITLHRPQSLDHLFLLLTDTAKPLVVLILILLFVWGFIKKSNKLKLTALQILGALIVTTIVVVLLKHAVGRPRPFVTYPFLWHASSKSNPSFPSGHTAVTFVIATILTLNYRKGYIAIVFFGWAMLVAYSRLDLGMHYPSDVLAGAVIGFIISWIIYKIVLRIKAGVLRPGQAPDERYKAV